MRKTRKTNFLSLILLLVLIAALALTVVGCDDKTQDAAETTAATTTAATTADDASASTTAAATDDPSVRGEGDTEFIFKVKTKSGDEKTFTVRTDKTIVGDALQEVGLIEGDEDKYGLYVKVVDGERVEYETDGKYWAFYVDGAYALLGVDSTEIEAGKVYSFVAE
jgi:hypothetical protein